MKSLKWAIVALMATLALFCWSPLMTQPTMAQDPPVPQTVVPTSPTPLQATLERLFTTPDPIPADWFADEFLAKVPIAQFRQDFTNIQKTAGTYQSVQSDGPKFLIIFDKATVSATIGLNNKGQIVTLWFQTPRLRASTLSQVVDEFKALPGKVGLLVLEDQTPKAAWNETMPLAVASAFKLAVLQTLKAHIAKGQYSWTQVVKLDERARSIPTGVLQDWPEGAFVTLETLAALMISVSDNTATDNLMLLLGRENVEANAPVRDRPLLLTRELALLRSTKNTALIPQYLNGNEAQRRALLKTMATLPAPQGEDFSLTPTALDIEWIFTAQELCSLMTTVADLPLMSINPGIAKAADWQRVAFKGGSEPGVISSTTALKAKNNKNYCVSAIWNQEVPVQESKFVMLYTGLLEVLKS